MKIWPFCCFAFSAFISLVPSTYANEGNAELFARTGQSLYKVIIAESAQAPKKSYGSGFAVSHDGLLMSNYHVVADALQDAENKYQVFIETSEGVLPAQVVAIDVIHDLSLLKVKKKFNHYLFFSWQREEKGDKTYSFGIPKDLGPTMSEGNYNGVIAYNLYQQLQLTSALNSGMSGGPTLNAKGDVIGVNVSILLDSQNISFAVPVRFASALVKGKHDFKKENAHAVIGSQLKTMADSLHHSFWASEEKVLENFILPQPSDDVKCWSNYKNDEVMTYTINRLFCQLNGAIFIRDGLYAGTYQIDYSIIKNKKRNPWQFFHLLKVLHNDDQASYAAENKDVLSLPVCQDRLVQGAFLSWQINTCLMAYRHYPDLYIADIKMMSLLKGNSNVLLTAHLYGFTAQAIRDFIAKNLTSIRVKP